MKKLLTTKFVSPELGLFLFRVILGFALMISGLRKYEMGVESVEALMIKDKIPEDVALVSAYFVIALEAIGGLLLMLGFGTRILALLLIGEFFMATFVSTVPVEGWFGARLPLLIWGGAVLFFFTGSGNTSVDRLILGKQKL